MMNGSAVSGVMLAELARLYVDAINSGSVPVLSNAWVSMIKLQNERATDRAFEAFCSHKVESGTNLEELQHKYDAAVVAALAVFGEEAMEEDQSRYHDKLVAKMRSAYEDIVKAKEGDNAEEVGAVLHQHTTAIRKAIADAESGGEDESGTVVGVVAAAREAVRVACKVAWAPTGLRRVASFAEEQMTEMIEDAASKQARRQAAAAATIRAEVEKERHEAEMKAMAAEAATQTAQLKIQTLEEEKERESAVAAERLEALTAELQGANDKLHSLEEAMRELKQESTDSATKAKAREEELKANVHRLEVGLQEREAEATQKAALAEAEARRLETSLQEAERRRESEATVAQQASASAAADLATAREEVETLRQSLNEARQSAREDASVLEKKVIALESAKNTAEATSEAEVATLKDKMSRLQQQVDQLKAEAAARGGLAEEADAVRQEARRLETQLEQAEDRANREATARAAAETEWKAAAREATRFKEEAEASDRRATRAEEEARDARVDAAGKGQAAEGRGEEQRKRLATLESELGQQRERFRVREEMLTAELAREVKAREGLEVSLRRIHHLVRR
mmetsp:Transcript_36772/g.85431  ORF Transcript_36772/g.85431 Transcript_36772/m.85431 type:complete len:576 (+) Transcript_36772:642-2369(+)